MNPPLGKIDLVYTPARQVQGFAKVKLDGDEVCRDEGKLPLGDRTGYPVIQGALAGRHFRLLSNWRVAIHGCHPGVIDCPSNAPALCSLPYTLQKSRKNASARRRRYGARHGAHLSGTSRASCTSVHGAGPRVACRLRPGPTKRPAETSRTTSSPSRTLKVGNNPHIHRRDLRPDFWSVRWRTDSSLHNATPSAILRKRHVECVR